MASISEKLQILKDSIDAIRGLNGSNLITFTIGGSSLCAEEGMS